MIENMQIKVDASGRILIPKKVRDIFDINKDDIFLLTTFDDGFKLVKEKGLEKYNEVISKIKKIEIEYNFDIILTDYEKVIYTSDKYKNIIGKKLDNNFKLKDLSLKKDIKLDKYRRGNIIIIYKNKEYLNIARIVCELLK